MLKWWGSPVVCPGWNAMSFSSLSAAEFMWTGYKRAWVNKVSETWMWMSVCLLVYSKWIIWVCCMGSRTGAELEVMMLLLVVSACQNTRVYAFGVFRTSLIDLFQLHGWIWHVLCEFTECFGWFFTKDSVWVLFQLPSSKWASNVPCDFDFFHQLA